jgi:hypothetical protein
MLEGKMLRMIIVLDRKLPREGKCIMLVADESLRRGNIAEVKTKLVIDEDDLQKSLMNAHYEFETMRELNNVREVYHRRYTLLK